MTFIYLCFAFFRTGTSMFGWSAGWLAGIWDLTWVAGRFWTQPPRRGVEVCEKSCCYCCEIVGRLWICLSHITLLKALFFFSSFFSSRSVLLRPSPCQSSQRSAHRPDLWHPVCLCRGECRRPLNRSERGPGARLQQGHRESGIPHLH